MGDTHDNLKDAMDSNVEYTLNHVYDTINTVNYEGQTITATNTIEKQIKSAILKGRTLVNVCNYNQQEINVYRGIKTIDANELSYNLTPNTRYLLSIIIENSTLNVPCMFNNQTSNVHSIFEDNLINFQKDGIYTSVVTTKSDLSSVLSVGWFEKGEGLTETTFDAKVLIIEYQDGMENWDIPYFEGMSSVKTPVLRSAGKNLLRINEVTNIGRYSSNIESMKICDVKLIPNTSYTISFDKSLSGDNIRVRVYHGTTQLSDSSLNPTFTTRPNAEDYVITVHTNNSVYNSISELQLEKGTTATPFEPYKSNILEVLEPLELLSEESTLDLITGEVYEPYAIRTYQDGDELDISLLTDMVSTRYKLPSPLTKTVNLNGYPVSYDGTTHYVCSGETIAPTLSIDVPTNLHA